MLSDRRVPAVNRRLGSQVDAQREDPVDELGLGIADHGVVGEVELGLLAESLALGALHRRHAARAHRLRSCPEAGDHLLGVEPGHADIVTTTPPWVTVAAPGVSFLSRGGVGSPATTTTLDAAAKPVRALPADGREVPWRRT